MKRHLLFSITLLLLVAAWATGCSGGPTAIAPRHEPITAQAQSNERSAIREETGDTGADMPTPESQREETTMPTPTPEATEVELPVNAQGVFRLAQEDLAGRLSIEVDQVGLVEVKAIEWSDASLGCPQPGMMYAQVITPGYRIVLTAMGKSYEYHTDTRQKVVYCEPQGAQPVLGGGSTEANKLAKEDLAQRLGISVDSIDVVAVIRQEFPVNAFYCRKTKERISRDESPAVVSGESILLSAAGRTYEYHANDETVIFCRQLP